MKVAATTADIVDVFSVVAVAQEVVLGSRFTPAGAWGPLPTSFVRLVPARVRLEPEIRTNSARIV